MAKTDKKMIKRAITLMSAAVLLIAFMSAYASALAVSMPYLEDKKMYLLPGNSEEMTFVVQNDGTDSAIGVKPNVLSGMDVLNIIDEKEVYEVPVQGRVSIKTNIAIPEDAEIGEVYPISIDFISAAPSGGGFNFGSAIKQSFSVVVGDSPQALEAKEKERNEILGKVAKWAIMAVVLGIAIYFAVGRRKKDKISSKNKEEKENFEK